MSNDLGDVHRAQFAVFNRIWASVEERLGLKPESYRTVLLKTPPFQGCGDNEILDALYTPARPVLCKNRPKLIEEMETHLYVECILRRLKDEAPRELRRCTVTAFSHLALMCTLFVTLRDGRTLSDAARSQTRSIRPKAIERARELLKQVVGSFTDDDYEECRRVIQSPLVESPLAAIMHKTLCTHGPARFSDKARYYAIASILTALEFEQGTPDTVAARLRKRVQRAGYPSQE
jgi:hypothetical protein